MSRPGPRLFLLPLLLAAATQLACPTVTIKSLEVLKRARGVVTLGAVIEVDNGEAYADPVESTFAIAAPAGWTVDEVRYQIPGEPLQRRARLAPGMAAKADWTYVQPGATWWGFHTAEHVIPTGVATYTAEIDVRVPCKQREGTVVLVVGEPGTEAATAAYRVTVKPRPGTAATEAPGLNPDAIVQDALAGGGDLGDLGGLFGMGGADSEDFMEGGGALGEGLGMLGSLLGAAGQPGYRDEWIAAQSSAGRLQLAGLSVAFPDEMSVMGDPPEGDRVQLVLFPAGAPYIGGLDVHLAVDEVEANARFDQEVQTAAAELATEGHGPSFEEAPVEQLDGAVLRTTTFVHGEAGQTVHTTLMARIGGSTMVLAAVFGDGSGEGAAAMRAILETVIVD